jgi:hypothetical protein
MQAFDAAGAAQFEFSTQSLIRQDRLTLPFDFNAAQ